jgi:hypothetical protein
VRRLAWALAALVAFTATTGAAEIKDAQIVLVAPPGTPGSEPAGAPPRFVLLKDGTVFVGGTGRLETALLERGEANALRRRAEAARRAAGPQADVAFGGAAGEPLRLLLAEDDPVQLTLTGDPAQAPVALQPLASFVADLLRFHHPSLRPYAPASYALAVREGRLVGGCRAWTLRVAIADALAGPREVPALDVSGWPTGAFPASVCVDDRRYVVTFRPLLPGERP